MPNNVPLLGTYRTRMEVNCWDGTVAWKRVLRSRGKCGKRASRRSRKPCRKAEVKGRRLGCGCDPRERGSAAAGRALGLPPPLPPVPSLMSWWFTSRAEEGAVLPPRVLLCVGQGSQLSPGAMGAAGTCWMYLERCGEGSGVGVL